MSSVGIITGILIVGVLGAARLHAQSVAAPKTDKAVVCEALSIDCQDSSRSHLKLNDRHAFSGFSAAWKDAHLFLRFSGQGADAVSYVLEAVITPDLHLATRLSATDKSGQRLSIYPTDQVLVLDHAPGKQPRSLTGRISFRGIAEGVTPSPTAVQYVVRGDFCFHSD